ncbi:hypothetical protein ACS0TY_021357 [Phlomoides rotata]
MTRKLYNLMLRSEENAKARRIIKESYKKDSLSIDALNSTERVTTLSNSNSSRTVLDSAHSTTKGRGKRIKGHFEKKLEKRKWVHQLQLNQRNLVPKLQNHIYIRLYFIKLCIIRYEYCLGL